ncbi:17731_t:CDS:2 [Cetraspora pellucida]|uniref:UDP-N-acetylglucosamine transferase subunit ALG14 n=1 Tax=Cetraspora pellucida TaxID=1433469 RepID=A0A9N9BVB6_9GLOM|nr:17731_t:CDS:2 [Cetraspora pellucida]
MKLRTRSPAIRRLDYFIFNIPNLINFPEDKDIFDIPSVNQNLDKADQSSKMQHDEIDVSLLSENNERYYTPTQSVCRRVELNDGSSYFDTPRPLSGNHENQHDYGSPTPKSSLSYQIDLTEDRKDIFNSNEKRPSFMEDFTELSESGNNFQESPEDEVRCESVANETNEEYSPNDEGDVHPQDVSFDPNAEMEDVSLKHKQDIQGTSDSDAYSSQIDEVQKTLDTNMKNALSEFEECVNANIQEKFDNFNKNTQQYIESKVKDEILKSLKSNDDNISFINNMESIIDTKVDKYIHELGLKFDDKSDVKRIDDENGKEINHKKSVIEGKDSQNCELAYKLLDSENDIKVKYSEIDKKISNVEISLKKFQENNFKPEVTQSKINEYPDFNNEFRNLQDLNKETEQRVQIIENNIDKLKQEVECLELKAKINELLENKFKEYNGKINGTEEAVIGLENKYQELSVQTTKILDSIKKEVDEVDVQIDALKKRDESIEELILKEIQECENGILSRLKEDREAKLAQMITAVKEEAAKVMERVDILEASDNTLSNILKENEEKIMKMIEDVKMATDKIIQEQIREAIKKYTSEYDETVEQRILEAVQQYEERVNKLEDTSCELENIFTEEIKTSKEDKLRSFEEDNQKLKESKREYKEKLLEKDMEIQELKVTVASNHSSVIRLEEDKASLERKVSDLKTERKQLENKIKDYENKFHEADRRYRTKILANEEDLKHLKQEVERCEKLAQKVGSETVRYRRLLNFVAILCGHTMEMIQLLREVDFNSLYQPRIYIVAQGDHLSSDKIRAFERHKGGTENVDFLVKIIPRSRNVGQSWLSTPFSVFNALFSCIKIILLDLPDLIICNGPGSCIPVCVISYIPRILGIKWIKLIYVESFARVRTLSLSGKLLLRFVDRFIVQWPYLEQKYPQAEYRGMLV